MSGVILYHADVAAVRGGYLGVDVFFVISGFLITRSLLAPGAVDAATALSRFWARRARRLVPALLVVLYAVAGYAEWGANPLQLPRIRQDTFAALGFATNWVYVARGVSYFDRSGLTTSPLQHLWSLAVEEQFYLVWPLVVGVVVAVARRSGSCPARALRAIALVGAASSATTMLLLARSGASSARLYYGTDVRAQAILAGCALAAHCQLRPRPRLPNRWRRLLVAAAAAGLLTAFVAVPVESGFLYRGGYLLIALLGAVVVSAATSQSATWVQRVLGVRPLAYVGRLSYGLYLWYWPVIVAVDGQRAGLGGARLLILRVALTGALAAASYHFVERPIRAYGSSARRRRAATVLAPVASALVVALAVATTAPAPVQAARKAPGQLRVFIAGDSSIFTLAFFGRAGDVRSADVEWWSKIGCGVVLGDAVGPAGASRDCRGWPRDWQVEVRRFRPQVSVISLGAWEVADFEIDGRVVAPGSAAYDRLLAANLDRARAILTAAGGTLVLLDAPCYRDPAATPIARWRNDPRRVRSVNASIDRYAASRAGDVRVVRWSRFLCEDGAPKRVAGRLLRPDGVHFDQYSAPVVLRWLLAHLGRRR